MLNLYPFNPGHVMVVPVRHVQDVRELTEAEVLEQHRLLVRTLSILSREYRTGGFNVGFNLGPASGASIAHLHLHVVPRHQSELGFFDVLSDSRAIGEDPRQTRARLTAAFSAEADPLKR
ncbi:MAG TPA: HIT domain-containing protein, partial [bacterium]|nr:HIT domain-containing protein [bacterium]